MSKYIFLPLFAVAIMFAGCEKDRIDSKFDDLGKGRKVERLKGNANDDISPTRSKEEVTGRGGGAKDSTVSDSSYCEQLARKLKAAAPNTDEYNRLIVLYKEKCGKTDSKTYCDELAMKLKSATPDTDEYNRLLALYKEKCGNEKDSSNYCDELARKLKAGTPNTDEHNKLMALYKEKCGNETDNSTYCEELRKKLSLVKKDSREYEELLKLIREKCK